MKKQNFVWILLIVSIFMIADGVLSIYTQYTDDLIYNLGRLLRIAVGVAIIFIMLRKKEIRT